MKIVDLLNAVPVLQELTNRKMPGKLAYAFSKNFRMINEDLEDYNKARLKLLEENWSFNQKTNKYDIPDEDQTKWQKMHDELIQTEAAYQPYKINIALAESIEMTPGEFSTLWFMFDEAITN